MNYSRRDLAKIGLAAAALPAWGKINSKINGVRIGVQSYSFRTMPLDDAIKAMVSIGIGECEVYNGHVEPRPVAGAGGGGKKGGGEKGESKKASMAAAREEAKKWRLSVSMDHFKDIRKKFDTAGILLQSYNLSFNDGFSDEE